MNPIFVLTPTHYYEEPKYVVPFIGALIDTHLFTTEKMLKKDFVEMW